MGSVVGERVV